jgi:glycosyltransferase involved in cell wall biosynthesis
MKIAVWHNLPSGGGKRALYNHVKVLVESGHQVEAWTTDMSSNDYLPLSDLIVEHRLSVQSDFQQALTQQNPIKRIQAQISIMQEHCKKCVMQIESERFDMIFSNSCIFSYMSYISLFAKIPTFIYLGEPFRPFFEAMPENLWQAPKFDLKLKKVKRIFYDFRINYSHRLKLREEIKAAKDFDLILVNSLYSRESVIRAYGIDATVCYLGIDEDFFEETIPPKENYVVGLGKISHGKGVRNAIRIIAEIPENTRPLLKWVSNGYDERYYNEMLILAKELKVEFEPLINLTDETMKVVLSKASVMLYTSVLEPFGLAPLEANACGTYVVAIAEGGVRESITNGQNGTLINAYKLDKFATEIQKFVLDKDYATKKGIQARNFVAENWNKQFMANNLIEEIESLRLFPNK